MRTVNDKLPTYFVDPLAEKLGITRVVGKRILTALVMDVLINNDCGVTEHNIKEVRDKVKNKLCSEYDLSVYELAAETRQPICC